MLTIEKAKEIFSNLISYFQTDQDAKLDCLRANFYFFSQYSFKQTTRKIVFSQILPCLQNLIYETYQKTGGRVTSQRFKRKWTPQQGLRGSKFSHDSYLGKDTNVDQFYQILEKVKQYSQKNSTNPSIIKITYLHKQKNSDQIDIEMQRGLGLKISTQNNTQLNSLFNKLSSRLQKKFMIQSFDSLNQLQKLDIEHHDVTYRNFVYTVDRYKVIDFDSAKINKKDKKDQKKLNGQDIKLSDKNDNKPIHQSDISKKYFQYKFIKFFTGDQLKSYKKNSEQFCEDHFGKWDVAMFGFMIVKLLIDYKKIDKQDKDFINQTIKQLQNIAYPYQNLQYNRKKVEQFIPKFFNKKYFKLIHYVLEKMLVPSFTKRSKFNDMYIQWKTKVNDIPDQNQSLKPKDIFGDNISDIKQFQTLSMIEVLKRKKFSGTCPGNPNNSQKQEINKQMYESRQSRYDSNINNPQMNKEKSKYVIKELEERQNISSQNISSCTTFIQMNQDPKNSSKKAQESQNSSGSTIEKLKQDLLNTRKSFYRTNSRIKVVPNGDNKPTRDNKPTGDNNNQKQENEKIQGGNQIRQQKIYNIQSQYDYLRKQNRGQSKSRLSSKGKQFKNEIQMILPKII